MASILRDGTAFLRKEGASRYVLSCGQQKHSLMATPHPGTLSALVFQDEYSALVRITGSY